MTKTTLTRVNIVDALVREAGLPRQQATDFLTSTLEMVILALVEEDLVKISSFGSFNVRKKAKRIGRNPRTKKEAIITSRRVLSFKPSQHVKAKLQRQGAHSSHQ
jgi:integration host factor subunit alpha